MVSYRFRNSKQRNFPCDSRDDDLIGVPWVMRATPHDAQDDGRSPSDYQDVTNDIHLFDPRPQVVLGSLDIEEKPDETEREQTEGKIDEEQPLPLLGEGATDEGSDRAGKRPDATNDPREYTSFRQGQHVGDDCEDD